MPSLKTRALGWLGRPTIRSGREDTFVECIGKIEELYESSP
jgi:hypothetical protein